MTTRTSVRRVRSGRTSANREAKRSVALIGTYTPRRCGIATFTADLAHGLQSVAPDRHLAVVALNDRPDGYAYPSEVEFEIQQNQLADYRIAASFLNASRMDAVCIQHEFGIFGGRDGAHILELMSRLRMPILTALHTVSREPSPDHRAVIRRVAELSDRIIVLTKLAATFLRDAYDIPPDKIAFAPHGIPDVPFVDPAFYKDQFDVEGRKVILSFGLLSPNKGIEHMIRAMPQIIEQHPDAVYLVLGATHPHVRRANGESYRIELQRLAQGLGIGEHVLFHDRYVDLTELCAFLGAADVYVTPYLSEEQIVSGTLAYAMGAGKPVVSTPYWYANEMLAKGRGSLVAFRDPVGLANAINELLGSDVERNAMRKRAYQFLRPSVWPEVARTYLRIIDEARAERVRRHRPLRPSVVTRARAFELPAIDLTHLRRLTDETGMLQHASYFIPNRNHGYCTDDNARALIVVASAREQIGAAPDVEALAERYLAFLIHAFRPDEGSFSNFMSYDRRWLETEGSPDSHGRAIWALGTAVRDLPDDRLRSLAARMVRDALPRLERITDLRANASTLLGVVPHLDYFGGDTAVRRMRDLVAHRLHSAFLDATLSSAPPPDHGDGQSVSPGAEWSWPEEFLTYDNARMPQALIEVGRQMGRDDYIAVALQSLEWLVNLKTADGHFSPIGNQGWARRGQSRARFDQQPIEAAAVVEACASAYAITHDRIWFDRAKMGFDWFLGKNDAGQPLYDSATGGCRDGLHATGVSDNEGAESTLAWLSALIQMHAMQAAHAIASDGRPAHAETLSAAEVG